QLLKTLKASPKTATLPVILLSARAGEEAKIEGHEVGADDYLTKPFSTKELLARVATQLKIKQKYTNAFQAVYNLFDGVPFAVAALKGKELIVEYANQYTLNIWKKDRKDVINKPMFEIMPETRAGTEWIHQEVYETKSRFSANEIPVKLEVDGEKKLRYFNSIVDPIFSDEGEIIGQLATTIEVTEQVLARKKIEEDGHRLSNILNGVNAGIASFDNKGRFIEVNERFCAITGYSEGELLDKTMKELIHPDELEHTQFLFKRCLEAGIAFNIEMRYIHKNGGIVWINISVSRIEGEKGKFFLAGVVLDITLQKKAEENLRYTATLTQNISDAIISTGVDGLITSWNRAAELMYGWTEAEMIGVSIKGKVLDQSQGDWLEVLKSDDGWKGEAVHTTKGGRRIYVLVSASVLRNEEGEVTGYVTLNRDITERKQMADALEEKSQRLKAALDASSTGTFRWNIQTNDLSWDENLDKLLGLSPGQTVQSLDKFIEIVHPEDRQKVTDGYMTCANEGADLDREFRVVWPDGSLRWLDDKGKTFCDEVGKPLYMTGACVDITEHKILEQSLNYQKQLLETVTENTDMALFLMDEKQHCVYMNEAAEQMTGYALEELKEKQLHYYIQHTLPDGSTYPLEDSPIDQALHQRKRMKGEEYFVHKDGSFYPVAFTASPIIVEGNAIGTVIEVRDTTEDKAKEQALRNSEKRFRHLIQSNIIGIAFWDMAKGFTDANETLLNMLGYSRAEFQKGLHWESITPEEWRDADNRSAYEILQTGHHLPFEKQYYHKDGHLVDVIIGSTAFEDTDNKQGVTFVLDISKRKKAENELKQSETLFRQFSNNIQNLAWMADGEGWLYWYNQRWYDYTGTTFEEMQGWGWMKVYHPDELDRVVSLVARGWRKNEPFELTSPLKGADGVYRWFLTRAVPITNEDGKIIRWIGTNTNVDEQFKAQEAVRRSEKELQQIFVQAPVSMVVFKGQELITQVASQKALDIWGKTEEEVIGRRLFDISPEMREEQGPIYRKVWETGDPWVEREFPLNYIRYGKPYFIYYDFVFQPLHDEDGKIYGIVSIGNDVTHSVVARKKIEESEAHFRTLAETLPQLVWMTDEKGRQLYTSTRWREYSGIQPTNEATWGELVHPDDLAHIGKAWNESLATGTSYKVELRLRNKEGEYCWFYGTGEPVTDSDGKIAKWIGAFTDIHQ
ncbi:MAG TPA: PAS domain S-box protein, partial [Chitinophagaceae bacterium]|nr:PAS domain S-box protein [Chitinophagaceae bacterium]